jgi:hypothetical protein
MGCASSKGATDAVEINSRTTSAIAGGTQDRGVKERKLSVKYQSKELERERSSSASSPVLTKRTSAQFEPSRLGTSTLHGVMPGPKRGSAAKAKVNQDRGVVCWPFCGSYNEALLCIFDGHVRQPSIDRTRNLHMPNLCLPRPELDPALRRDRAASGPPNFA